jgi:LmbE family N-acetylglucosaminyl deacetylase
MITAYPHVYLSPHYDDASLSCGGAIHQQVQNGWPVLVLTIFAAAPGPEESLSPLAQAMHQSWGNPRYMVTARQAEDQAAMQILGADYVRLNLADCIYRGRPEAGEWYYPGEASIFGQVHTAEELLPLTIADAIEELVPAGESTVLYAPLAVGHHVDHQLVCAAARQLQQRSWLIAFYEDYPYVDPAYPFTRPAYAWEKVHTLAAVLTTHQPAGLQPQLQRLAEQNLQAKLESVGAYASQLGVLFGSKVEMERRLQVYTLEVGQGIPAERIWLPV